MMLVMYKQIDDHLSSIHIIGKQVIVLEMNVLFEPNQHLLSYHLGMIILTTRHICTDRGGLYQLLTHLTNGFFFINEQLDIK